MNEIKLLNGLYYHSNNILILPRDLVISTITLTFKVNFNFNTENLGLYFNDFDDFLIEKHYLKKRYNKKGEFNIKINKNKKNKDFKNQISFLFDKFKLTELESNRNKIISIKLFDNGSVQLTGCKDLYVIDKCIVILFDKLKNIKEIDNNGIIKKMYYIDDEKMLKLNNANYFNISMVNTSFKINYHINRQELYNEIIKNINLEAIYDPANNVSVIIKYNKTSIFIFETGKINISSNLIELNYESYIFINNFIFTNATKILTQNIKKDILINIINECKKELTI